MRNLVIGSLLVLLSTSAFAEYRETWVSPGQLKNLEAGHKSTGSKSPPAMQLKQQTGSSRPRDQQGRASHQLPSDPIAEFARDDGGVREKWKSQAAPTQPRKAKIVRQKVSEEVGDIRRTKAVSSSVVV
ncbi:hypothetical protein [Burkholderia cenocepacia]|uniref:hypothetical protein n=1 Tax=Burkholderia cenocepacia TaxID=95486 RepID=UPI00264C8D8D|nr:hypothetical protein [Burkholderia cenocepacia]MDN7629718.1 hypothetical protein [Burkholderia cenocepacia]